MSEQPATPSIKGYVSPSGVLYTPAGFKSLSDATKADGTPEDVEWVAGFEALIVESDAQVTSAREEALKHRIVDLEAMLRRAEKLHRDIGRSGLKEGGEQYPNELCCIDVAQDIAHLLGQSIDDLAPQSRLIVLSGCEYREEELLRRAVRNAKVPRRNVHPRWVHIKDVFSVGSGVASAICRRFKLDPDEVIKS